MRDDEALIIGELRVIDSLARLCERIPDMWGRLTISGRWYYQAPRTMRVVVYRQVGSSWVRYGSANAVVRRLSATTGTYSATMRISKRGYWRVVAVPDYAPASYLWSPRTYFRLR